MAQYFFRRKYIRERVAPVLLDPVEDDGGFFGRQKGILIREPGEEKPRDDPEGYGNRPFHDLHMVSDLVKRRA